VKIIITGAVGHIGSRLLREFAHEFPLAEIVLIDNMMTQRFGSLFNLPAIGRYRFVEGDVTKMDLLPHFAGADVVVHLAAVTDAVASFERAAELEENNYRGTAIVAHACAATGTSLIMLSSTSVYGTQNDSVSEDCSEEELRPQSPYAETKLKEEILVTELCRNKGLKAVICRFGTIFGPSPGMRFHTAVNKFCWQAVMGQPVTVWTTALEQKRPYLDLLDASRAITFIIQRNLFDGRVLNVVTLNASVRYVIECIQEFIPRLEVDLVDSKIMNQLSYEVRCEKLASQGFLFIGNLKKAIAKTISWMMQANGFCMKTEVDQFLKTDSTEREFINGR
jgi:UDP-glucose 4-epimerase